MGSFQRLVCAIKGHEDYLHFDANRVYLQCVACGHESPGWSIESRRPVLPFVARRAGPRRQSPVALKKIA